jgi:DnaJ-class molecular chaperone
MKDYYTILNVSKTASQSEIKIAFRKLALEHHPDKGGDSDKFKDINEAYEILSDEEKRGQYDNGGLNNNFEQFNPFEHFQNFGNFSAHFGNQFPFNNFGFNPHQHQQHQQHQNNIKVIKTEIQISIFECFTGINKNINFIVEDNCNNCSKKCNTCNGSGHVEKIEQMHQPGLPINFCRKFIINCTTCNGNGLIFNGNCSICNNSRKTKDEEKIDLFIFPGIHENLIMSIKYSKNNKNYELNIKCNINYHNYIRNGFDLIYKINIPFINSITGNTTKLLLPDNNQILLNSLDFNEIIQNNKHYLINYKGLPMYDNNNKKINDYGKLYIEYNIEYPKIKINIEKKDKFIEEFNNFIEIK